MHPSRAAKQRGHHRKTLPIALLFALRRYVAAGFTMADVKG
jgi:hypothetical protein